MAMKEKTKYDQLAGFNENFQKTPDQHLHVILKSHFQPDFATIPVMVSSRLQSPAVVTLGPDWHHEDQFLAESPSKSEKIGILIPSQQYQNDKKVLVRWLHQFSAQIADLQELGRLTLIQYYQTQTIHFQTSKQADQRLNCFVYDCGHQNLFEVSYYEHLVTAENFQQLRVVGPAFQFESLQSDCLGVLLFCEGWFAVVLWEGGSINRHKIGQDGVFELTYV